ncbi:hypothetical protein OAP63_10490 [Vibrio sp.]|nr:hypothetical protein [Vibrio sp.]
MVNKTLLKRIESAELHLNRIADSIRIYSQDGKTVLYQFSPHNAPTWTWYKDAPDWMLEQLEVQRKALGMRTLDDFYS